MRRGGGCSSSWKASRDTAGGCGSCRGRTRWSIVLDASRSHTVPEDHYRAESRGVLVVDRYAAYKAMSWVKDGVDRAGLLLGSCAAGLHPGGQGLAGVEDVGLGMAAADSRALPAERPPVGGREGLGGVRGGGWLPAPGRGRDEDADGDRTGPGGSGDAVPEGFWRACKSIGKG